MNESKLVRLIKSMEDADLRVIPRVNKDGTPGVTLIAKNDDGTAFFINRGVIGRDQQMKAIYGWVVTDQLEERKPAPEIVVAQEA